MGQPRMAMISDHELMVIHADTGFTYDARGRMLLSNEPYAPDRRPAPRLFLGRTGGGNVLRFGATASDTLVQRLTEIIDRLPAPRDLERRPAELAELGEALTPEAPLTAESGGPTYRFPNSLSPSNDAVLLTDASRAVLRETFPWLCDELLDWQPCFAFVRDGAAVSVCFSSRIGREAAAAGVETLPEFRGHGYATAVTSAWATAIRESGRIPLYSTSWENHASQGVARRLGLIMFGADATWS